MARLNNKRGRKSNYLKSLNNDYHRSVRERALLRDGFRCKLCDQRHRLELHHISYEHQGNELEHMETVVILCETHHQEAHNDPNHVFNPKNPRKKLIK